ncbi:MAG: MFS transporter [Candidatus Aminicenantes bacterium]|nr:MFS transporter [Candidatus Aminicenantes bacterium]
MSDISQYFRRISDIRDEEAVSAPLLFTYFFLITTSVYIVKPVKISTFLAKLEPHRLPYAYLLTALIMGLVVALNTKLVDSVRRQLYISASLIFFAGNLVLFWFLFKLNWIWISMIYWIWADIFTIMTVTQFWITINDIYHPRQAKRLVGFLVSGGLLGGISGSLLSAFFARSLGTENLLLICPVLLLPCIAVIHFVYKKSPKLGEAPTARDAAVKRSRIGYKESFDIVRKSRYLLLLSSIMGVSVITTTLVDFQFNSVVESAFFLKDSRTAFLGAFFTGLLIFSYLLHILLTNRILKNFGFKTALMIAPIFLLFCSFSVFFLQGVFLIYWAAFLKGGDKSLAHSLNQSVRELLYIPISSEIKFKAKVFIDMFINKFAKGIAAVLLLIGMSLGHISLVQVSIITAVASLIWLYLNQKITKEYVGHVKNNLHIKWQDADKLISEAVDIDLAKLVFDTIQSKEKSSVLYAMNLFDLLKRENLSPEMRKVISLKSNEILASSMDSLLDLDGELLLQESDDLFEQNDLSTQVKEIMSQNVYHRIMKEHIGKLLDKKGYRDEVARMEAAKMIGMLESPGPLARDLIKLLQDDSPEVLEYAIESAGKLKHREFVPHLISQLSNPLTLRVASKALIGFGSKIVGTLKDYLGDESENIQARKAIPDILAHIGTQRTADFLCLDLHKKESDLESEVIEALYKMRLRDTQIHFQRNLVLSKTLQTIKKCYLILSEMHDILSDKKKDGLRIDLERNLARHLKHVFELLSLIYPLNDIIKAYQNIRAGTKKSIDYSIELLENTLQKDIKEFLVPLIDDISFADRVRKCKSMIKPLEKVNFS